MASFDPYGTLGVAVDAPDFVIQAAYRACLKKYHPDVYGGADARQRTADILEAYRLIGDAEARSAFDGTRPSPSAPPSSPRESDTARPRQEAAPAAPPPSAAPKPNTLNWLLPAGAITLLAFAGLFNQLADRPRGASNMAPKIEVKANAAPPSGTADQIATQDDIALPSLPKLDDVLKFTAPAACAMSASTQKLFDGLIKFDPKTYVGSKGADVAVPGFPAPISPVFSRKVGQGDNPNVRDNEATLALSGTWHGLRVSKIRVRYMEESSFWEQQIRFLEPAAKVEATLNGLGFSLPAVGDFREFTGEGVVSAGIGVEEIPGGSALYCGSSSYY